ncbi:hypothetical protein HNP77_001121 [Treponema rectale]|uniref:Peptidase M30 n=1 Tax=Treponema rectale TaxID=744512 RepID=A0A840SH77_9SPIR|nr:hypothetical protein [Treponema rectale]MBB5218752.1 hypothetical protein [Treponema rectale]
MKIFNLYSKGILLAAGLFTFSGCGFLDFTENETTEYYASDEDTDFVKTLGSANTITLENVKGKTILYVNYNESSSSTVSSNNLRYLSSSTGLNTSTSGITARTADAEEVTYEDTELKEPAIKHFIPKSDMGKVTASGDRSAVITEPRFSTVSASDFTVGETKSIFVDTNSSISSFAKKTATLYAKNSFCLVWVVSGYTTTNSASGKYVNTAVAEYIAEKFASLYNHERAVFGEEGELLIHETSSGSGYISETEMKDGDSPTGSLVNIVIYDIGNDYKDDNTSGVVGYFYSKDYWVPASNSTTMAQYSNEGKYFYLDSSFCNYVSSSSSVDLNSVKYAGVKDSEGNSIASDTALTTLFHEFQHMINYNQKDYGSVETWYNEMLSMLAEDMFATGLGVSEDDAPWGARFPAFNSYYFTSGIDEYRTDDLTVYSYSTAYAFGAWLAREFGGPELVSLISQNEYTGMDSIRNAIYELTGENLSANQLRRRFIQACAFRNDFAAANDLPTLNKDAGGSITEDTFTSVMNALDIYSSDYVLSDTGVSSQLGPAIYKNKSYPGSVRVNGTTYNLSALRPHGFQIHYAGVASSDTVTLNFTSRKNSSEDVIILIQDEFDNTVN